MNRDELKGKAEAAKGKVKQAVGDLTDDPGLHDEGVADETAGQAQDAFGRAKRKVGDAVEKGEPLCLIFADEGAQRLGKVALEAMKITRNPPARGPAVIERLRAEPM